jgi:hypothetical protein
MKPYQKPFDSDSQDNRTAGFFDDASTEDFQGLVIGLYVLAGSLASLAGVLLGNRATTIELYTAPTLIAILILAVPLGVWMLIGWFRHRPRGVAPPEWNLKHDSPGLWAVKGILLALITSGFLGWTVYQVLDVLVQRLPGRPISTAASVVDLEDVTSRASSCKVKARFLIGWGNLVATCVTPRYGESLADAALVPRQQVSLIITNNVLGRAVTAIKAATLP